MPRTSSSRIAPTIQVLRARLHGLLRDQQIAASDYQRKSHHIQQVVLEQSKHMRDANFNATCVADLRVMSELYDAMFLDASCLALARHDGLAFRWSSRMTRAGGKTTRFVSRATRHAPPETHYEIALSSSLIFQTFRDDQREVRVCGCPCKTRLQAMQRIVEHELIHLAEMLVWIDSDCAAHRFQSIAHRFFGHTEHRHELVTQRERAQRLFDIKLGSRVSFTHDGRRRIGFVNRITRRATVLVESPTGILYSDGKRYEKFYIPIAKLRLEPTR